MIEGPIGPTPQERADSNRNVGRAATRKTAALVSYSAGVIGLVYDVSLGMPTTNMKENVIIGGAAFASIGAGVLGEVFRRSANRVWNKAIRYAQF
jgi:hypothetical protein